MELQTNEHFKDTFNDIIVDKHSINNQLMSLLKNKRNIKVK